VENREHDKPIDQRGYGKPPANRRFQKGQSGNPKGRPRGKAGFAKTLERALQEQVIVNDGGRRKTVTKLEAAFMQIANKAASGDPGALRLLIPVLQFLEQRPEDQKQETSRLDETDEKCVKRLLERLKINPIGETDQ
jgi:hypothetical protein